MNTNIDDQPEKSEAVQESFPAAPGPIGIFDSGYGGLTILHGIRQLLPQYDYIYLGDNARAPYGPRSFDVVYEFTRQAVQKLFEMGCQLVILGCNTASAKALRSIQQHDLPQWDPKRRVLGVIRPTAEIIGKLTRNGHVGLLATEGTVKSHSYDMEIAKLWPNIKVTGQACPFWVPLVEYNEADSPGADYFVKKRIDQLQPGVRIVPQGEYVADSLKDYLLRHTDMASRLTTGAMVKYYTTENPDKFKESASIFLHERVHVEHIELG